MRLRAGHDGFMSHDVVFDAETAAYCYLSVLPLGTRMTVHTRDSGGARTNVLAVLKKENRSNDWRVLSRAFTADAGQLPETWPNEHAISTTDLAKAFTENAALWARLKE